MVPELQGTLPCNDDRVTPGPEPALAAALPDAAREVEEFVDAAGWDQPPQLFALVRTAELVAAEPGVASSLDLASPLTPIAQEPLPPGELDAALAGITWPSTVAGCAAAVHIVVLPPDVEADLDPATESDLLRRLAAEHPRCREARLVAAVLRDGPGACVLRLRGGGGDLAAQCDSGDLAAQRDRGDLAAQCDSGDPTSADAVDELVEHPDLAPNLLAALHATFEPE
jgi:hypothetical protein